MTDVEHTLQITIQAAMDIASHIVSGDRLGEPKTNHELLARGGMLPHELAQTMRAMAGFRNILVHGYAQVQPAIVQDIVENRLDDLLTFVAAIRTATAA